MHKNISFYLCVIRHIVIIKIYIIILLLQHYNYNICSYNVNYNVIFLRDVITLTMLKTQLSCYILDAYEISASQNIFSNQHIDAKQCVASFAGKGKCH